MMNNLNMEILKAVGGAFDMNMSITNEGTLNMHCKNEKVDCYMQFDENSTLALNATFDGKNVENLFAFINKLSKFVKIDNIKNEIECYATDTYLFATWKRNPKVYLQTDIESKKSTFHLVLTEEQIMEIIDKVGGERNERIARAFAL